MKKKVQNISLIQSLTKRWWVVALILFALFFFAAKAASAQEDLEALAKKHGVSFPIAELSNCDNFSECKSFCDNEANRDACISFAKKKGFYKQNLPASSGKESERNEKIINEAKSELGCDSEESCRAICERQENIEKCSKFAERHGLGGPRGNPGDRKILQKAREILGCDSEQSCKSICENPDNQEKCSNFAKETGLGGGTRRVGPGGCNSEESCRKFCGENPEECRKFGGGGDEKSANNISGPGGCKGPDECKKYCSEHEDECKNFGQVVKDERREEFCKNSPEKCIDNRGRGSFNSGPGNREDFCRQNPDKCKEMESTFKRQGEDKMMREKGDDFRRRDGEGPREGREEFRGKPPEEFDKPTEGFSSPPTFQPSTNESGSSGEFSGGSTSDGQDVRGASTQKGLIQSLVEFVKFKLGI